MIADILNSGFEGIPISYSPRTDDVIALTLLACFFLSSIALARGKKFPHPTSERLCAASRADKHF